MTCSRPSRHRVGVACLACGTLALLHLTVTPLPAPPGELRLRTRVDPDDLVMVGLWERAHRGPFRPLGAC